MIKVNTINGVFDCKTIEITMNGELFLDEQKIIPLSDVIRIWEHQKHTIADYYKLHVYADTDVTDNEQDAGEYAFCWYGETPEDNYDRFLEWYANNVEIDHITTEAYNLPLVVARLSDCVREHMNTFTLFSERCSKLSLSSYDEEDDKIFVALRIIRDMVIGNYAEEDYKFFMELVEQEEK